MKSTPSAQAFDFLDRTRDEGHDISAVTVWEIEYGICRLDDGKRHRNLKCMFDGVLAELFKDRIDRPRQKPCPCDAKHIRI